MEILKVVVNYAEFHKYLQYKDVDFIVDEVKQEDGIKIMSVGEFIHHLYDEVYRDKKEEENK